MEQQILSVKDQVICNGINIFRERNNAKAVWHGRKLFSELNWFTYRHLSSKFPPHDCNQVFEI